MGALVRALAFAVAFAGAHAQAADPVAFLADLKGDVVMDGVGRPPVFAELLPGTRLALGPGATGAVMFVTSGEEFAIKGPGEFVVTRGGVKADRGEEPKRRSPPVRAGGPTVVRVSRAATASLRMRSLAVPAAAQDGPQYPVNARIATLNPVLRWKADDGTPQSVTVSTVAGREVFRATARGTSLQVTTRLAPSQAYLWSVSTGGKSQESRFETLAAEAIAAAEKARAAARSFADRAALAMRLEELGAEQDAREVWAQLATERPDLPELAGLAR